MNNLATKKSMVMTRFRKLISVVIIMTLTLAISCSDDEDQDPQGNNSAMVYLAGNKFGEPSSPGYWKENAFTVLDAPMGGDANAIYVSGSNVYVGGRTWTNNAQTHYVPCFWKNGTRHDLPLPYDKPICVGIVNSIEEGNGVAYAAGFYSDSLGYPIYKWMYQPCLWKSNADELTPLEPLGKDVIGGDGWWGRAESVKVITAGNKTGYCVAGNSSGPDGWTDPCYWTVGMDAASIPSDEIEAEPLSTLGYGGSALAVSGILDQQFQGDLSQTDLLFAGYVDDADGVNVPCYWYKGDRTDLSRINPDDHGVATAISHNGTAGLLVAGYTHNDQGETVPCMWDGGERTDLPLPAGAYGGKATAIRPHNGDVYVGGTISINGSQYPCYWKNGEVVQLSTQGEARAISLGD